MRIGLANGPPIPWSQENEIGGFFYGNVFDTSQRIVSQYLCMTAAMGGIRYNMPGLGALIELAPCHYIRLPTLGTTLGWLPSADSDLY